MSHGYVIDLKESICSTKEYMIVCMTFYKTSETHWYIISCQYIFDLFMISNDQTWI